MSAIQCCDENPHSPTLLLAALIPLMANLVIHGATWRVTDTGCPHGDSILCCCHKVDLTRCHLHQISSGIFSGIESGCDI
jgi:hypothetical protein